MNPISKFSKSFVFLILSFFSASSFAAVDAAVTTALSDMLTDVGVIAAGVFIVTLLVSAYRKMRSASS